MFHYTNFTQMYMANFTIHDGHRSFAHVASYTILGTIAAVHGQVNLVAIGKTNPEKSNSVSIINLCMYYLDLINIIPQFYALTVHLWSLYFEFFLAEFKIM